MSTSRIGINFAVKKFPINVNFDMRINCREEFNFLRYSSKFAGSNVGISFLNSKPISVSENIIIQDLTDKVKENSPRKYFERIELQQNFIIESGDFQITDVFKTTSQGDIVPLYLRHDLSFIDNISEVEILDSDFNPVSTDLYAYYDESLLQGEDAKFIYTNLENSYSRETNEYTIYYYRYKDSVTGRLFVGLLDTKTFYKIAEFASPQSKRAYRIEQQGLNSAIEIWFNSRVYSPTAIPTQQKFSVKSAGSDRISLIAPLDLPPSQRWYPRISLSEFYRNSGNPGERLFYHVPEYYDQFFTPVPPFKSAIEKEAIILDEKLIYVNPSPIANLGITGFYLYIVLRDEMNRPVRAFTNDPIASIYINKDKIITDIYYEKDMIQSTDSAHGFIRLNAAIDTSLKAFVTYRYEEPYLTYRDVNVNSTMNPDILNSSLLFYVIPEGSAPNVRSVFHIQTDDMDNIIDAPESIHFVTHEGVSEISSTTQIKDSTLEVVDVYTNFELEVLSGTYAGKKIHINAYNTGTKTLTLAVTLPTPISVGTKYRINKKSKTYTTYDEDNDVNRTYTGWIDVFTEPPYYYVLLGNMYAVQTLATRDIESVDIRLEGGGIKTKDLPAAIDLQDETQWYWDIGFWDGQAYPGMGAIIVEIPRKVLQEVGGLFTRDQVRDIVEKHMAEGSYPIIRYYDQSTIITKMEPGNTFAHIKWQDVSASSYNIYIGTSPTLMQLYRNVAGIITEFTIEGLTNDTIYYFKVESVVGGYPQLPSKVMMAIPYDPSTVLPGSVYGLTTFKEGTYQS